MTKPKPKDQHKKPGPVPRSRISPGVQGQHVQVEQKNKGGRPHSLEPDETTLKTVNRLASQQYTIPEAAAKMKVSKNTLRGFLDQQPSAKEAWDAGRAMGAGDLRRAQIKLATAGKGNADMLKFLGKQYLGQRDKIDVDQKNTQVGEISHATRTMTKAEAAEAYANKLRKGRADS